MERWDDPTTGLTRTGDHNLVCVKRPSSTDAELSANLEFACGHVDLHDHTTQTDPASNPNTFNKSCINKKKMKKKNVQEDKI
ncbi:hypothetical protein NC652_000023 [Populus alba x Populus x berolinensis]|nr:hypothetical protein NC652_000023 [Populus alba x Populus x berolinensis]